MGFLKDQINEAKCKQWLVLVRQVRTPPPEHVAPGGVAGHMGNTAYAEVIRKYLHISVLWKTVYATTARCRCSVTVSDHLGHAVYLPLTHMSLALHGGAKVLPMCRGLLQSLCQTASPTCLRAERHHCIKDMVCTPLHDHADSRQKRATPSCWPSTLQLDVRIKSISYPAS